MSAQSDARVVQRTPLPASPAVRAQLIVRDTLFFPEGLDVDPRTGAIYITSMAYGQVIRVDAAGAVKQVLPPGHEPMAAVFGVAVDTVRNMLWLTTAPHPRRLAMLQANAAPPDTRAALLQVRLHDGVLVKRWLLGDSASMPGELAVLPNGDVVVSDGIRGVLYRVRGAENAVQTITHPLLRSPQGMTTRGDGRVVWIADWSRGLLRWDTRDDSITQVTLPEGGLLRGIDGLRIHHGWHIAVQNGATPTRVVAVRLDDDGSRIEDVRVLDTLRDWNGEPTVGAVLRGAFVYVSTSQWPHWTEAGARRGAAALPPVILRHVMLERMD
jgi:streptogramin lyase